MSMHIDNPINTLQLARRQEEFDDTGLHYLFTRRREGIRFYLDNADRFPSEENYTEATDFLNEITEMTLSVDFVVGMLSMYPQVRIKLAVVGDVQGDSDVRDTLADTLTHFLLGCSWPTFGDQIDIDEFMTLLRKQVFLLREEM